jgi:adenylate cyclase
LTEGGARVIAFDLIFNEPCLEKENRILAQTMREAPGVVLCQYLKREEVPLGGVRGEPHGFASIETLSPLCPPLQDAATATAPFPLPKVPVRLSQFWKFKASAGEAPTLPVVSYQIYVLEAYDIFRRLLEEARPREAALLPADAVALVESRKVGQIISDIRTLLRKDPEIASVMLAKAERETSVTADLRRERTLTSLIHMYSGEDSGYLNYYGPPGTVTTLRYEDLLERGGEETAVSLRGSAVFVGLSESVATEQKDGFYTVYSGEDGIDLSGVEIAATAFANLLEDRPVRPLSVHLSLLNVFLWGAALAIVCVLLAPLPAAAGVLVLGALYLTVAASRFSGGGIWSPLVVPLLIQAPLAVFGILGWKYFVTDREQKVIKKAIGYYLPDVVIEKLSADFGGPDRSRTTVYGTCLFTDAEEYTRLSEDMKPEDLAALLNRYYETLFRKVKENGGNVSDIIGDAMLAIWAAPSPDADLRDRACLAALGVDRALGRFNESLDAALLPTRIGLHSGFISLGNVGAVDHYHYTPIGDIVNTASRLEGLNKHLGTRILVSAEVIDGLEGFLVREMGQFLLAGKSKPVTVYELICSLEEATEDMICLEKYFAAATAAFRRQSWDEAIEGYRRCLRLKGGDGPSRYFLNLSEGYRERPPGEEWDGLVRLNKK